MAHMIIIGSGVAGLAAACRLRTHGFDVTVLEANAYPGGKLTEFSQAGFRFDAGPSLFTMPHLLDEVFIQAGRNPRDYYTYRKLDTTCHYFYEDGTRLHAYADHERLAKELEDQLGVNRETVIQYLKQARHVYETAGSIFLENSLHRANTWFNKKVARALFQINRLGIHETLHQRNRRLLAEPRAVQLFDRFATYNGSDPYRAPGILSAIPHLEFNLGVFIPTTGMHDITQGLFRLATELGVQFKFKTLAEEIKVEGQVATGVRTHDDMIPADGVISNQDVYKTYHRLLPNQPKPVRYLNQERSSSALIFYWGINRPFPELHLHNILFSNDYQHEFSTLFKTKSISNDPTIYINITSKYCPDDAPVGCENWFVMVNVPANQQQDWSELIKTTREHIIAKINRNLNINLEEHLVSESILDPILIEQRTSSYQGSLYGTSSNSKLAAFLRHPNFSNAVKNLFFCGGSVHPGGGIPLCLQSARITSELVVKQFQRSRV